MMGKWVLLLSLFLGAMAAAEPRELSPDEGREIEVALRVNTILAETARREEAAPPKDDAELETLMKGTLEKIVQVYGEK